MQPVVTSPLPADRPTSLPAARWLVLAVCAIYLVSLATVGSSLLHQTGFPLDDSWIHQTVARNFAAFHSLGYFPHQRSSGSTSLLWTLLLSLNYGLLPHLSPVVFCLVLNGACFIAIGLLLLRIALADGMHPLIALLWSAAPALDGNFVWLAFTGMEHILFVTLSLAAISLWLASGDRHRRASAIAAGLALGTLVMVRPEGLVLGALLLLLPGSKTHRRISEAVLAGCVAAPFALAPFAVNLITSHTLLPVTFQGRKWMYSIHNGTPLDWRIQIVEQWMTRPFKAVMALDGARLPLSGRYLFDALTLVLLVVIGFALRSLWRRRDRRTLVVCFWGAVHSFLYLVLLPTSGHGGRYQPFLLLLLLPLLALGLLAITEALGLRKLRTAILVPALSLLLIAVASLSLWRRTLASDVSHIESSHGAMAAYLHAELPHTTVAVFDIGRIGYDRSPYLLDLGGLTEEGYLDYLYRGQVPLYLRQKGIAYVVLPQDHAKSDIGEELGIVTGPDLLLTPLHVDCTPEPVWQLAWIQTKSAARCQELDRITYR